MFSGLSSAVTGALAFAAGALLAGAIYAGYDHFIDDPYIRKTEQDACTIRTQDAANRAEQSERARQAASVKAATEAYSAAIAAQEQVRRGIEAQHEQEITDYERQLSEAGRSCPLSLDDLNWLRRQ